MFKIFKINDEIDMNAMNETKIKSQNSITTITI